MEKSEGFCLLEPLMSVGGRLMTSSVADKGILKKRLPFDPDLIHLVGKHLWFEADSGLSTGEQGLSEPWP